MLLQELLNTQNSAALTPGLVRTLLQTAANGAPAQSATNEGSLFNLLSEAATTSSQKNVTALSALVQTWLSNLPTINSADAGNEDTENIPSLSSQAMPSFTVANESLPISEMYPDSEFAVAGSGQFSSEAFDGTDIGLASSSSGGLPNPYQGAIAAASQKYGVPVSLIQAVMEQESGMNPSAVSPAGAMGLMQLMPTTATTYGVSDPFNPAQNIDAGTHYLANLLAQFGGNTRLALAAYNAGPASIAKYGGIPPYPQTEDYVASVMQRASNLE